MIERHDGRRASASPGRRGRPWMAAIAAGFSLLATLIALEAVLHLLGIPRTKTGHQRFFVEHDPDRGWRNVPGAEGNFSTDEYDVHLQYNSRGIRGPERSFEKPAGTFRVVLLGDSFLEGYSVPREKRVAEVLEGILAAKDPSRRFEVIALGTAGYSTDQELLWLESEGLKYRPDLVVDLFYMNDVWFNGQSKYWRGEKPAFVLEDGRLRLTNVPVPDPRAGEKGGERRATNRGLRHWIRSRSKIYALVSRALEGSPALRGVATRLGLVAPRDDDGEEGGPRVSEELSVFEKDPPPATRNAWTMTEALLAEMKRKANAAGAGFVAFHIPFKGTIHRESWAPILSKLGIPTDRLDPDAVRNRFDAICAARQLDCIEPTARFREEAATLAPRGERLYYVVDNHWNPGGHRLAAEILAERILAAPGKPAAGSTSAPATPPAPGTPPAPDSGDDAPMPTPV